MCQYFSCRYFNFLFHLLFEMFSLCGIGYICCFRFKTCDVYMYMLFEITVYRCILENVSSSHISTINCKHLIFHIFDLNKSQHNYIYIHINLFDLYMFTI